MDTKTIKFDGSKIEKYKFYENKYFNIFIHQ